MLSEAHCGKQNHPIGKIYNSRIPIEMVKPMYVEGGKMDCTVLCQMLAGLVRLP